MGSLFTALFFESLFPEFFAPSTEARGENSRREKTAGAGNNKLHAFDAEERRQQMKRSWGMTTVLQLAGHSEKRSGVVEVNRVGDGNPGESGQKRDFGGSRAGNKKKKRLDELTGIYSQRVVSRPFRVTGCVLSDRDTPQGNPGAKNQPVTLAHSEGWAPSGCCLSISWIREHECRKERKCRGPSPIMLFHAIAVV